MGRERRRLNPRVHSTRPIHARAEGIDATFRIMDISLGGFRVRGPVALLPKATHTIKFVGPHISEGATLHARVAYCRKCDTVRSHLFEMGFAFLPAESRSAEARLELIEHLISVFEFERSMTASEDREEGSAQPEEEGAL